MGTLTSKRSLLSIFVILFAAGSLFAQTITDATISEQSLSSTKVAGKVFRKAEADSLFGPVQKFVTMSASQFESLANLAGTYIMLRFEDNNLYMVDSKRRSLFSFGFAKTFLSTDVFKKYSVSVVKELLSKGQSSTITIEQRADVMSVTDGEYTMEKAEGCPPFCAD